MKTSNLKGSRGLSLIEVMVSFVVLVGGIVGFMSALLTSVRVNELNTEINFANNAARQKIEEIMDRWYQGDRDPSFPVADYFKVRDTNQRTYLLKHDRERDAWFLFVSEL